MIIVVQIGYSLPIMIVHHDIDVMSFTVRGNINNANAAFKICFLGSQFL
jgi:hypothetical protein